MRHLKKKSTKLNRTSSHRKAMLANMAASLIRYERIQTTDAKAKALRPFVEKLLTLSRRGDLHARRLVQSRLRNKEATKRLFEVLAPRFMDRPGGYTRIVKIGPRSGDNAPISLIEFVDTTLEDVMRLRGHSDEAAEALLEAVASDISSEDASEDAPKEVGPVAAAEEVVEASSEVEATEAVAEEAVEAEEASEESAEEAPAEEAPAEETPAEEIAEEAAKEDGEQ
ncbi:MAG: 50S ribosomal protein L17 [Myxococcota bacterium]